MLRPLMTKVGSKPLQDFCRVSFPRSKPATVFLLLAPGVKRYVSYQAPSAARVGSRVTQPADWYKIARQVGIIGGTVVGLHFYFNRETREGGIPAVEQSYLRETFQYVGAGLGITALSARGLHLSGWSSRFMALNPWVAVIGGLGLSIGRPRF